jgi:hypothetical protein
MPRVFPFLSPPLLNMYHSSVDIVPGTNIVVSVIL